MRVLVTGRDGQVARSLLEKAGERPDIELLCVGRPELDLAHPATVYDSLRKSQPDIVVSAAAYTAVDKAEDEPALAHAINAQGAEAVAAATRLYGIPVVHLSTDYVFAGDSTRPYTEEDLPSPRSVYGHSKLQGELLVAAANPQHVILRTAWVYSPFSRNFVKTMLNLAHHRESISVVADQFGNPTSALDIADAIYRVIDQLNSKPNSSIYGLYNLVGQGDTNWSNFAKTIFAASSAQGGPTAEVIEIMTSEYPTKANRPMSSCLSSKKFEKTFGFVMPEWRASLFQVIELLLLDRPGWSIAE